MTETTARVAAKPTTTTHDVAATRRAKPAPAPAQAIGASVGLLHNGGPALLLGGLVQTKVVIGAPNDPFEQEADRVADDVVAGQVIKSVSRLPAGGLGSVSQRQPAGDEEEPAQTLSVQRDVEDGEEEPTQTLPVQRLPASDLDEEPAQMFAVQRDETDAEEEAPVQPSSNGFGGPTMRAAAAHAIRGKGAGEPLKQPVRGALERGMGVDLGSVRIHASASANSAAQSLNARAFTHRNHIWLGAGESQTDLKLLAHETTHVLQQDGVVRRKAAVNPSRPEDDLLPSAAGKALDSRPSASPSGTAVQVDATQTTGAAPSAAPPAAVDAASPTGSAEEPRATSGGTFTEKSSGQHVDSAVPVEEQPGEAGQPAATDAQTGPGKKPAAAGQPQAGAGAQGEEVQQHSPTTPAEDPAFQKTLGKIKKTRKAEAAHVPPRDKEGEVTAAAVLPVEEQKTRNARSDHLTAMKATAEATESKEQSKPTFSAEAFKAMLKGNLAKIEQTLPQSEEAAKEFKREKPLEGVKQDIGGQVAAENAKVTGPMASQVKQDAPPSTKRVEEPHKLVEEKPGDKPKPISASAAAVKPRLDSEVSMARESQSLDDKMAQEGITEDQLAQSNEPTFVEALDTKRQAQQEAADAPGRYREKEEKILARAQQRARSAGAAGFDDMHTSRSGAFTDVFSKQSTTKTADEAEQTRILGELDRIYNATKTDVDTILNDLSSNVDSTFETEAGEAKKTFETQVEDKLDDIYGITVIDDWLFGEDTEAIEKVFRDEKDRFLAAMDRTLDKIAEMIASQLNAAIDRIKLGRKDADDFYNGLSTEQQRLAKEAMEVYTAKYDTLEETVQAKQEELAQTLAQSYKDNVDALRESFDKIKEEVSRGWIGKAIDFIVDVATAIKKLGELLLSIISRVANIISDILAHPIRFLENLASGVVAGFRKFVSNLDTYLISGFFDWLRGSVGGAAIEIPDSFDPQGLFNLVTQVLGLNYQTFRDLAVEKFGEPTVAVLEKGAELAEGGLELFRIAQKDGLGALWTHIKEMIASNVSEIFEQVKETILYQTIEKVLAFVGSLFTPVGAFIKAVQTLYRGLRFLVDNIDRIAELVDAFLSSLELAVQGNVAAITDKVVLALRSFIVVAIDFLAKLVGLGNLGEKVRKILNYVRQPIIRAMKWLLNKVSPLVNRIKKGVKAVAGKGKAAVERLLGWWGVRQPFKQGGKPHTLYFKGSGKSSVLVMHSKQEQVVSDWLVARREAATPPMRPFVEEALVAYARFNLARDNLEALRTELEALPAPAQQARRPEYETVYRIFSASLRDLGRTFSALPVDAEPERIVLHLSRFKQRALYQQHARSGRLQHSLQRPQRQTNQLESWRRHARTEMTMEWMDYGRRLGLPDNRILVPDWDRNGARTPMQVDHRIEWQVRPLGDERSLDEPWNYELLDAQSNRVSGASIDREIRAERQRIATETGDHSWLARDMTFTSVEGGGNSGRRWSLEDIANGEHLKVYARRYGAPASSGALPSAEKLAAAQNDGSQAASGLQDRAGIEVGLRSLVRRYPAQASQIRAVVALRLNERSWNDVRSELGISAAELKRLRELLSSAGVRL